MQRFLLSNRALLLVLAGLALPLLGGCATKLEKFREQGISQYKQGDYDQSLETFKAALRQNQFDAQSNAYSGLIRYRNAEYQLAEYHFNVALQADPSSEIARDGLTDMLIKVGRGDEALNHLERHAKLAEKVKDPRHLQSNVKHKYTMQIEERLYVGKVDDRLRIARAYQRIGDFDNAFVYYKKALEIAPKNPAVLMAVASLSEQAGNREEAAAYLNRAYDADPKTPGLIEAMTRNGVSVSDAIRK